MSLSVSNNYTELETEYIDAKPSHDILPLTESHGNKLIDHSHAVHPFKSRIAISLAIILVRAEILREYYTIYKREEASRSQAALMRSPGIHRFHMNNMPSPSEFNTR